MREFGQFITEHPVFSAAALLFAFWILDDLALALGIRKGKK